MSDNPVQASSAAATDSGQREAEYVVVARRYRPTNFEELIGQEQVSLALKNAIETHRVGHAYLFTGARGVGKTSTARIFAKALNCVQGPTAVPCNECDICLAVASGDDVDVIEIDGASNRGIEEIRQLRSTVNVRPSRSRFKIYIIDEVHMLTTPAFNALLKTLEEPPEHVKFIFCTTDPEKIPITVLSRCQRFDFPPVSTQEIQTRLEEIAKLEGVTTDPEAMAILARRAAGSMRDSQSLLEQLLSFGGDVIGPQDVHRLLGTADGGALVALFDALTHRATAEALRVVDTILHQGVDAGQMAEQMLGVFRDAMVVAHGGTEDLLLSQLSGDPDRIESIAHQMGGSCILASMQILDQSITRMRQTLHARTLLEMAIVRICGLEDLDAIDRMVRQLAVGKPLSPPPQSRVKPNAQPVPAKLANATLTGSNASAAPAVSPTPENSPQRAPLQGPSGDAGASSNASANREATVAPSEATASSPPQAETDSKKNEIADRNPSAAPQSPLGPGRLRELWREVLDKLQDTTCDFASDFRDLAIVGPNTLVVTLNSSYNKEMCDRPDRKRQLESMFETVSGKRVAIEFRAIAAPPAATVRPTATNRRQLMREATQHPWVNEAISLFDGEVVDLRPYRAPQGRSEKDR